MRGERGDEMGREGSTPQGIAEMTPLTVARFCRATARSRDPDPNQTLTPIESSRVRIRLAVCRVYKHFGQNIASPGP